MVRALAVVLAGARLRRQNRRMERFPALTRPPESVYRVDVFTEHPGGCYTCRHFGERLDPAVWCRNPGHEHVRSQAERGCAFWEREPGSDD